MKQTHPRLEQLSSTIKFFNKKLNIFIWIFALLFVPFVTIKSQGTYVHPDQEYMNRAWSDANKNNLNGEATGKDLFLTSWAALSCELSKTETFCGELTPAQQGTGVIPAIAGLSKTMYQTPPANLALWVDDTAQTLGFKQKTAYAQGTGFSGLSPLLNIWKVFRNMAYILLALAIIVIGFMVMFRRRIDPHTVVTVQNALPKVVMALILITFSYAIVGLLIDLMYVVLFVAYGLFSSVGLPESRVGVLSIIPGFKTVTRDIILNGNLPEAFGAVFPGNIVEFFFKAGEIFEGSGLPAQILGGIIGGTLLNIFILVLFIRLLFMFLGAYIQIILSVIFGPLMILADVFPGSNAFANWLKNLVANLGVFAVAGIMFMLSIIFEQASEASGAQLWMPPYTTLWAGSTRSISALFSIGIVMLIPTVVAQFKQMVESQDSLPVGGAVMGGLAGGIGQLAGMGGRVWGFVRQEQIHHTLERQRQQAGEVAATQSASTESKHSS